MRRRLAFHDRSRGLVAIYDALLFLMVVILVAEGMFLYTATVAKEGGQVSEGHWQHLTGAQLAMVEGLSLNGSHPAAGGGWTLGDLPSPLVEWTNGTTSWSRPLEEVLDVTDARTVAWLLASFCELTARDRDLVSGHEGDWDGSAILPVVDSYFRAIPLNGTHHAWLLTFEGEVMLFGSDEVGTVDELPDDRWAASGDYSGVDQSGGVTNVIYEAELRYFIWLD